MEIQCSIRWWRPQDVEDPLGRHAAVSREGVWTAAAPCRFWKGDAHPGQSPRALRDPTPTPNPAARGDGHASQGRFGVIDILKKRDY